MSDVMVAVVMLFVACGYVLIAGLVHEVGRSWLHDEVLEGMAAVFWPLIPPVAFIVVLLKTFAIYIPRAIVTSVRRYRQRVRIPRAQVRR